jgi:hypothetical protein
MMTQPSRRLLPALVALGVLWPASAMAAGNLPVSLGLGIYQPTTTNIAYPNYVCTYQQTSGFSAEVSFGPIFESGVQLSALALQQKNSASASLPGACASSFNVTQIPVIFETTSGRLGPVRLGGGLGYDFAQVPPGTGSPSGSGVVGDTFIDVGVGSGAALEGKYIFGTQSGLGGFFIGITTKL